MVDQEGKLEKAGEAVKLLKSERQDKILDILLVEKKIIASEMSVRLGVSEDTIRRDIKELRNGPAKTGFCQRMGIDLDEKIRIAKKGTALIEPDSVVMIDDGTTNYQLVKQLDKRIACTIITNSIPIVSLLEDYPNVKVITLGGNLFKPSMSNLGYETIKQLDSLHPDLYFMGIYSISNEVGITHSAIDECQLKQKMLSVSFQTAALVTKEKMGSVSNYVVCKTSDITYLITDADE